MPDPCLAHDAIDDVPLREVLLVQQSLFPSACLLHTLRWLVQRDQLTVAVWDEEEAFETAYTAPESLAGALIHVPHGLFPDGSQLKEQLRLAGVQWNYLPPGPSGGLLKPGALSQWLASGTPEPWQPHVRKPQWRRIPTINAREVQRWH